MIFKYFLGYRSIKRRVGSDTVTHSRIGTYIHTYIHTVNICKLCIATFRFHTPETGVEFSFVITDLRIRSELDFIDELTATVENPAVSIQYTKKVQNYGLYSVKGTVSREF